MSGPDAPRDLAGRFYGPRVNVEDVPRVPSTVARHVLEDPRRRPYLAVWAAFELRVPRVALAVQVMPEGERVRFEAPGIHGYASTVRRPIPCSGSALFWRCPDCGNATRFLYLHRVGAHGLRPAGPGCAACSGLRWSSQGRPAGAVARALRGKGRPPLPRQPWDPAAVVSSPEVLKRVNPGLAFLLELGVTGRVPRRPTVRDAEALRGAVVKARRWLSALEELSRAWP